MISSRMSYKPLGVWAWRQACEHHKQNRSRWRSVSWVLLEGEWSGTYMEDWVLNLWSTHTKKRRSQRSVKTIRSDSGGIKARENILDTVVSLPFSTPTWVETVALFCDIIWSLEQDYVKRGFCVLKICLTNIRRKIIFTFLFSFLCMAKQSTRPWALETGLL